MSTFWSDERGDPTARLPRRLILLRHGQTDWNDVGKAQGHADIPLNDRGRAEATAVAQRLVGWEIDALYTSDLSRAAETAAVVGKGIGHVPVPRPGFREIDIGAWSGLRWAEIVERFPDQVKRLQEGADLGDRGGETFGRFHTRVRGAFDEIAPRHVEESVLVVTHGGVVKSLVGMFLGVPPQRFGRIAAGGNTGLTTIEFRDGLPYLRCFNDDTHLRGG